MSSQQLINLLDDAFTCACCQDPEGVCYGLHCPHKLCAGCLKNRAHHAKKTGRQPFCPFCCAPIVPDVPLVSSNLSGLMEQLLPFLPDYPELGPIVEARDGPKMLMLTSELEVVALQANPAVDSLPDDEPLYPIGDDGNVVEEEDDVTEIDSSADDDSGDEGEAVPGNRQAIPLKRVDPAAPPASPQPGPSTSAPTEVQSPPQSPPPAPSAGPTRPTSPPPPAPSAGPTRPASPTPGPSREAVKQAAANVQYLLTTQCFICYRRQLKEKMCYVLPCCGMMCCKECFQSACVDRANRWQSEEERRRSKACQCPYTGCLHPLGVGTPLPTLSVPRLLATAKSESQRRMVPLSSSLTILQGGADNGYRYTVFEDTVANPEAGRRSPPKRPAGLVELAPPAPPRKKAASDVVVISDSDSD